MIWRLAACVVMPFLAYGAALSGPFVFDDTGFIVDNPTIREVGGNITRLDLEKELLNRQVYSSRPLTFLTFSLNYRFGHLDPFGYRFVNILLHGLNAALILLLTRKTLLLAFGRPLDAWAFAGALLFAAHPLHSEVAAYVSHRTESLAAFFFLLAWLAFIASVQRGSREKLAFSAFGFCLALASKEVAITFPAAMLLYDGLILSAGDWSQTRRRWRAHAALWGIAAAYLAARPILIGRLGDPADASYSTWTSWTYGLTQCLVVLRYIQMLFVPIGQTVDHFVRPESFRPVKAVAAALLALAYALAFLQYRRERPASRIILFAALFFAAVLAPTSSFLPIVDPMAERRVYLASWSWALLLLSAAMIDLESAGPAGAARRRARWLAGLAIYGAVLFTAAHGRAEKYRRPWLLWEEAVRRYPNNARAHHALGVYFDDTDPKRAAQCYENALRADPNYALAYNNLGGLRYAAGDLDAAERLCRKALEIDPELSVAHNNLGHIATRRGDFDAAERHYSKVIELASDVAIGYNNLANVALLRGDKRRAAEYYEKALSINPRHPLAHQNLGGVYDELGDPARALEHYEQEIRQGSATAAAQARAAELRKALRRP